MKYLWLIAASVFVCYGGSARAQACPAGKYCYYVPPAMIAAPYPDAAATTWSLEVATTFGEDAAVDVYLDTVATSYTASMTPVVVTLSAGSPGVASGFNVVESRGAHVVSDRPLSTLLRELSGAWTDTASIKMHRFALGKSFYAGGFALNDGGPDGGTDGYDIVSLYAPFGATITLTPPPGAPSSFWDDGFTGTVTLAAGQTTVVRTLSGVDLTRTRITSDKHIAVNVGGRGWSTDEACGEDGFDNIVPESAVGTSYFIQDYGEASPAADRLATVVALNDGTQVTINGAIAATLAAGESYPFVPVPIGTSQAVTIQTSAPAYVYQSHGPPSSCELGMAVIPPASLIASVTQYHVGFNLPGNGYGFSLSTRTPAPTITNSGGGSITNINGFRATRYLPAPAGAQAIHATQDAQLRLAIDHPTNATGSFAYYSVFRRQGCGDGTVSAPEVCDDNNALDFDDCSTTCQFEATHACAVDTDCALGLVCDTTSLTCVPACFFDSECADGNECTTDTCDASQRCANTPVATGTTCVLGPDSGVCNSDVATPVCVECLTNVQCAPGLVCDGTGSCIVPPPVVVLPTHQSTVTIVRPTFTGTAQALVTVDVSVDGASIGTTTADADGNWSLPASSDLSEGDHAVNAVAIIGVEMSVVSNTNDFTVDVACVDASECSPATPICGPANTCIQCLLDGDCPTSATCDTSANVCLLTPPVVTAPADGATTNDTTPDFVGTGPASTTVTVSVDTIAIGSASVDASGNWTFTPTTALNYGPHQVQAVASSGVVTSAASNLVDFTIIGDCLQTSDCPAGATCDALYTCVLTPPVVITPADGALLDNAQPTFSGTAVAGATVTVIVDGASVGTAAVDGTGVWSLAAPAALAAGQHTVSATAASGAVASAPSNANVFTIVSCVDTNGCPAGATCNQNVCVIAAPIITSPADGSSTEDTTPTIAGTALPGATVSISIDGAAAGTAIADGIGNYSFEPPSALAAGDHTVTATQTIGSGDDALTSASSAAVGFTVIAATEPPPSQDGPFSSISGGGFGCSASDASPWMLLGLVFVSVLVRQRRRRGRADTSTSS